MGIFEITNNVNGDTFNASFYYEENASPVYLFQNEELTSAGDTRFITYLTLPQNFAVIPFYLESDQAIVSYSLTQVDPRNGITNHSQVGAGKIQFNILRNSQHYLELNILIYTGFFGTLTVNNYNGGNGGRYLDYQWIVNGEPLNSSTRINANGAPSSITILEANRLQDINVQLTLNVSFEADSAVTDFNSSGATVVSGSQFQTIFTANNNNLDSGTIIANYTINNTYVEPPPPPPPPPDEDCDPNDGVPCPS
jgi:hypothetical protein